MTPTRPGPRPSTRAVVALLGAVIGLALFARPAVAHAGSLSGSLSSVQAPFWLVVVTGGGIVAASFLFATLVTDHETIRAVNDRRLVLPVGALRRLVPLVRVAGVVGLVAVVVVGLVGPSDPLLNLAVLTVWVGWWAGYTMSAYLVADSWWLVNPWRTLASLLPSQGRSLPDTVGAWPSVIGLLTLVWLEVVSPVGERPTTLAVVVLVYTVVTLVGAAAYGEAWFERVDPVARVFRLYGLMAPVQRDDPTAVDPGEGTVGGSRHRDVAAGDGGVELPRERAASEADSAATRGVTARTESESAAESEERDGGPDEPTPTLSVPGTALARYRGAMDGDDVAFVVALLWVTSYDGLVSTPTWNGVVGALAGVVPPLFTHLVTVVVGFGLFLGVYRLSTRYVRRTAETYVTTPFVAGWFAPALVPIAAGYHVAHFLGYFLSLAPALAGVLASPVTPPASVTLVTLPGWFGSLQLGFVVAGHLLAVWIAHARAFELFPGRLQPIQSQYPFVVVMIVYTMTSLWIVAQPFTAPIT
ncbi:hypothetical protein [Salinigranum salinum]|uniref:hypothetical protein n=1 Tax=Salinigranum salinum TaxID=1364937 RepID=UPI001260ECAB|nr:hypothetical protein [Salinigranum salinum]